MTSNSGFDPLDLVKREIGNPDIYSLDAPQAEPSSGVDRRRFSAASSHREESIAALRAANGKRKRRRVTPEQLVELEREFVQNKAPTATQRKAISDRLGMEERQTQIWFQNRRAKSKLTDRPRSPDPADVNASSNPAAVPPEFDQDIPHLIKEKEPVSLIACSDLKIGHWRRINPSIQHRDLLAYTCESRQSITWFVRSAGLSFKIELPYEVIQSAKLEYDKGPGLVTMILDLQSIPMFYIQQPDIRVRPGETPADVRKRTGIAPHLPLPSLGVPAGEWVPCNDWTQNRQASTVLQHEITGPAPGIILGAKALPKRLGLFPETSEAQSTQPPHDINQLADTDYLHALLSGLNERESSLGVESSNPSSPGWRESLPPPSVHTPGSHAGSQYAHTPSSSIYASSAYTPGSIASGYDLPPDPSNGYEGPGAYPQFMPDDVLQTLNNPLELSLMGQGLQNPTQHISRPASIASHNSSRSSLASVGLDEFTLATTGLLDDLGGSQMLTQSHMYMQEYQDPLAQYSSLPDHRRYSDVVPSTSIPVPPQSAEYGSSMSQSYSLQPQTDLISGNTYGNVSNPDLFSQNPNLIGSDDPRLFQHHPGSFPNNGYNLSSMPLHTGEYYEDDGIFAQQHPQANTGSVPPEYLQYSNPPNGH